MGDAERARATFLETGVVHYLQRRERSFSVWPKSNPVAASAVTYFFGRFPLFIPPLYRTGSTCLSCVGEFSTRTPAKTPNPKMDRTASM
jgi:hypothetical protein